MSGPTKIEAPTVGAAGLLAETRNERLNSRAAPLAGQALEAIEGECYARAWLDRLRAGTAQPGELAVILSFLTGNMLHGAWRLIEKALGVHHHA